MAVHRGESGTEWAAGQSAAPYIPQRENTQRVMRVYRKGRFIFLEELAFALALWMARI